MNKIFSIILLSLFTISYSILLNTGNVTARTAKDFQIEYSVPGIMDVPPENIYKTWQDQYRIKPDKRFLNALDILIELVAKYHETTGNDNRYRFVSETSSEEKLNVSLLKNDKQVKVITLQVPVLFSEQINSMQKFLEIMGVSHTVNTAHPQRNSIWTGELDSALSDFNMVDARSVIEGMTKLDKLGESGLFDPGLLVAAARGYSILTIGLSTDLMQHTERFYSKALAFLSFAKQIAPGLETELTEAIVANCLGYTAHANKILGRSGDSSDKVGNLFKAYIQKDIERLKKIKGEGSKLLGYYLLTRLYRESGFKKAAKSEIQALYKRIPDNFPVMVENIFSNDFNRVKRYTTLYQKQIYVDAAQRSEPKSHIEQSFIANLVNIIQGKVSNPEMSFEKFDELLAKGKKAVHNPGTNFFLNSDEIDNIYRSLYSGAVNLRFDLLFNRWNVVDSAERYARSFQKKNSNHPQAMFMKAAILDETGHKKEGESLFINIINHPDASLQLILNAHKYLDVYSLKQNRILSDIVLRLDSRPSLLHELGKLFYTHLNYDYAEKYYRMSINLAPYSFNNHKTLSGITGNDKALKSALKKYSGHVQMLKVAGDYYATRHDKETITRAIEYYEKAFEMEPSSSTNAIRLSACLKRLERYDEAIDILKKWIDGYGDSDNPMTIAWAGIADCYLKKGQPISAMEILIDSEDLYRLVRLNIESGLRPDALSAVNDSIDTLKAVTDALYNKKTAKAVKLLSDNMHQTTALLYKVLLKQWGQESDKEKTPQSVTATLFSSLENSVMNFAAQRLKKYGQLPDDDLKTLIATCIKSNDIDLATDIINRTIRSYERAIVFFEENQDKKALKNISVRTDDYQKSIIARTARVYEDFNQFDLAEKTLEKGLKRYFTVSSMFSDAASFMWRNGRYEEAAALIADGNKNQSKFSGWFIDDFMKIFSKKTETEIMKALNALSKAGIDSWYISSIGNRLLGLNRPETAYKIVSALPANKFMIRMENYSRVYNILKQWKGEVVAINYLVKNVKGDTRSMLSAALFSSGHYKPVLSLLERPDSFSRYREFVWLQRLMAWLAVDKQPESLQYVFDEHYEKSSSDYYNSIGKYLSGIISKHQLLKLIRTPKQRCEISYYIGFGERMKGNFPEAADWYQICRETLLENNGEYHWAFNELFWWGHTGTTGRHRLMSDDKNEYYLKKKI